MSTVFQEVAEKAKRIKNPAMRAKAQAILLLAAKHGDEIQALRKHRNVVRSHCQRDPTRNATTPTCELHAIEYEAVKFLCPALAGGNGDAKTEGWKWVMRQPWAQEFKAPPFEQRIFM